jgi:hypothetical protein
MNETEHKWVIKENDLLEQYQSLTKKELIEARKNSDFKESIDWARMGSGKGPGAIFWTQEGVDRLLISKGLKEAPRTFKEKSTALVHAIVKQKYVNKQIVSCEIRGIRETVKVKDSSQLKLNSIIPAEKRGDSWVSSFTTDQKGRIHA